MTTLTHLTGLDVTEVTRSLVPLISGEPTDHGLRLVAVSDVADGQAIEVTLQDTTGARRHLHLYAVDVTDTVPHHYTDLGEWCPHSGQPHTGLTCPAGCSATAPALDRVPHRRPRHRRHRPASHPRGARS